MQNDDDFSKKNFDNDLGIRAQVQRGELKGKMMKRANHALGDLGEFICKDCGVPQLKDAVYAGSAAVHVFVLPSLKQALYVTQTDPMGRVHEFTASEALRQLQGDLRQQFGRKRIVRRSGA